MEYKPSYTSSLRADIQPSYNDSLQHHGILGQKWGIRRFQNKDGSLTKDGKARYNNGGANTKNSVKKYQPSEELKNNSKAFNKESIELMNRFDKDGYENVIKGAKEVLDNPKYKKEIFERVDEGLPYARKAYSRFTNMADRDIIDDEMGDAIDDIVYTNIRKTQHGKKAREYQNEIDELGNRLFKYRDSLSSEKDKKYFNDHIWPGILRNFRHDVFEESVDGYYEIERSYRKQYVDEYIKSRS